MTRPRHRLLTLALSLAVAVGMCAATPVVELAAFGCGTSEATRPTLQPAWLPADLEFTVERTLDDPALLESLPDLRPDEVRLFTLETGREIGVVTSFPKRDDDGREGTWSSWIR